MKPDVLGYIKIAPHIFTGQQKCCRPTFALAEGKRVDLKFEGKIGKDLILAAANFISSLAKKKINVYINYQGKENKALTSTLFKNLGIKHEL